MKDQYVGDINDFRKYGLIRSLLTPGDLSLLCCWMKTPDDSSSDGSVNQYLAEPGRWRDFDPPLFDALGALLDAEEHPGVRGVERSGVLPRATFVSDLLPDRAVGRGDYFKEVVGLAQEAGLAFFDPDNGFEVKSKPRGRKDSSKYLFWDEVAAVYAAGASVLAYQHYPRVERGTFTRQVVRRLRLETGAPWTASFSTSHVLFVLAPQARHAETLSEGCRATLERWGKQFAIRLHRAT